MVPPARHHRLTRFWLGVCAAVLLVVVAPVSAQLPAPTLTSVTASGDLVTLTFPTDLNDFVSRYLVEAGTAPGLRDLVQGVPLQHGLTGSAVRDVPAGTYFVRIRLERRGQVSEPSNEVAVTVRGCALPLAPALDARVSGQFVTVEWNFTPPAGGCWPTALSLDVGRAPGTPDVLSMSVPDFHIQQRTLTSVPFGLAVNHCGAAPRAVEAIAVAWPVPQPTGAALHRRRGRGRRRQPVVEWHQ